MDDSTFIVLFLLITNSLDHAPLPARPVVHLLIVVASIPRPGEAPGTRVPTSTTRHSSEMHFIKLFNIFNLIIWFIQLNYWILCNLIWFFNLFNLII